MGRAVGLLLVLVGGAVMIGWTRAVTWLLQIRADFAAMQFNTALCFVCCGVALVGTTTRTRWWQWPACAVPVVLGAMTAIEYATGVDLGIDQLFVHSDLMVRVSHAGRMGPNTATGFVLVGLAAWPYPRRAWRAVAAGVLGALALVAGATTVVAYAVALPVAIGWQGLTYMALHTAICFVALGVVLVRFATRWSTPVLAARWVPLAVGLATATVMTVLWLASVAETELRLRRSAEARAELLAGRVVSRTARAADVLEAAQERWSRTGAAAAGRRQRAAAALAGGVFGGLRWDPGGAGERWVQAVSDGQRAALSEAAVTALIGRARSTQETQAVAVAATGDGSGLAIAVPRKDEAGDVDVLAGSLAWPVVIGALGAEAGDFAVRVAHGDHLLFSTAEPGPGSLQADHAVSLRGCDLMVQVAPTVAGWRRSRTVAHDLLVASGLVVALLLALFVRQSMALSLRAAEFSTLLEISPTALVLVGHDGVVRFVNAEAARQLGYRRAELVGMPVESLVPSELRAAHRGQRQRFERNPARRSMSSRPDLQIETKSGERVPVQIGLAPVDVLGSRHTLASVFDLSERKRVEEVQRAYAAELERSNRELEQFAQVASHDLQEPLRMVLGFADLLEKESEASLTPAARKYLGFVRSGADRMSQLIDGLLALARVGGRPMLEPVDCEAVVDGVADALHLALVDAGAELSLGELPTLQADAGQLRALFQNLIANAIRYRSERPLRIQVDASERSDHWELRVRDNGIGIDPAHHEKIFAAFERLHRHEEIAGCGMGLAICRKVVERHGGGIAVESSSGAGATFVIRWPKAAGPIHRPAEVESAAPPA